MTVSKKELVRTALHTLKLILPSSAPVPAQTGLKLVLLSASPSGRPAGQQASRPSGIVLFVPYMTLASKAKWFVSLVRPKKYSQTLTLLVIGVI